MTAYRPKDGYHSFICNSRLFISVFNFPFTNTFLKKNRFSYIILYPFKILSFRYTISVPYLNFRKDSIFISWYTLFLPSCKCSWTSLIVSNFSISSIFVPFCIICWLTIPFIFILAYITARVLNLSFNFEYTVHSKNKRHPL